MKPGTTPYKTLHHRVNRLYGSPNECSDCGTTEASKFEWANITGVYEIDRKNWHRVCVSCHRIIDRESYQNRPKLDNCKYGHPLTNDNVIIVRQKTRKTDTRRCKTCANEVSRVWMLAYRKKLRSSYGLR